jgi:hypothetical protein
MAAQMLLVRGGMCWKDFSPPNESVHCRTRKPDKNVAQETFDSVKQSFGRVWIKANPTVTGETVKRSLRKSAKAAPTLQD